MFTKITCNKDKSRFLGELLIINAIGIMLLGRHIGMLQYVFIKYKQITIHGWSIAHFLLFLIMGLFCAKQTAMFMLFGVLWELFEYVYGHLTNDVLYWTSGGIINQFMDIFMNFSGYTTGQFLSKYI